MGLTAQFADLLVVSSLDTKGKNARGKPRNRENRGKVVRPFSAENSAEERPSLLVEGIPLSRRPRSAPLPDEGDLQALKKMLEEEDEDPLENEEDEDDCAQTLRHPPAQDYEGSLETPRSAVLSTPRSAVLSTPRSTVIATPRSGLRSARASPAKEDSGSALSPLDRLRAAQTLELSDSGDGLGAMLGAVQVTGVVESGILVGDLDQAVTQRLVDVNSGGELYFVFFKAAAREEELCCVVKFNTTRMQTQGEALAYELADSLGAPSAKCRIMRKGGPAWEALCAGVQALCPEESSRPEEGSPGAESKEGAPSSPGSQAERPEQPEILPSPVALGRALERSTAALVIELVNGPPLSRATAAFADPPTASATAASLARLFALDLILANADRLPCACLGWRGNPANVRWAVKEGRVAGIDHTLARRPPRMLPCSPDAVANVTASILEKPAPPPKQPRQRRAVAVPPGRELIDEALGESSLESTPSEVKQAFRDGLEAALAERGAALAETLRVLLECLDRVLATFFGMLRDAAGRDLASTSDLREVSRAAGASPGQLREAFQGAEEFLNSRLDEVRVGGLRLAPGMRSFLGSDAPMIAVSAHELRTRLRHILPRLQAAKDGAGLTA